MAALRPTWTLLMLFLAVATTTPAPLEEATSNTTTTTSTTTTTPAIVTAAPTMTRTALHVARSLDPEATQTLDVRTRSGEIATLIVKRRGGKSAASPTPVSVSSGSLTVQDDTNSNSVSVGGKLTFGPVKGSSSIQGFRPPMTRMLTFPSSGDDGSSSNSVAIKVAPVSLVFGDDDARRSPRVPAPVFVSTGAVQVTGQKGQSPTRSLVTIDSDGVPVVHGVRVPDDASDRHTWRNARVVDNILVPQSSESSPATNSFSASSDGFRPIYRHTPDDQRLLEYINGVNQRYQALSASASRARVLHYPGAQSFPTSRLYAVPSKPPPKVVSFEDGVRTPVLQYAHPELGVQPAKVARKRDDEDATPDAPDTQTSGEYFAQDIHSDRSPYAYEPGLLDADEVDITTQAPVPKAASVPPPQRDYSYGFGGDSYVRRYPYPGYSGVANVKYGGNGGYYTAALMQRPKAVVGAVSQQRPFWETLRDHVQSGMERVSDLTRPVVEPLVEATHKISRNLGLSTEGFQDKVDASVAAYPVLLPALGLVAGGAALGLGAVAVGRYLDADARRRSDNEVAALPLEHKRDFLDADGQSQWLLYDQGRSRKDDDADVVVVLEADGTASGSRRVKRRSDDDYDDQELFLDHVSVGDAGGGGAAVEAAASLGAAVWGDTACAKKVFCDAMVRQSHDAVVFMEKKMAAFFAL